MNVFNFQLVSARGLVALCSVLSCAATAAHARQDEDINRNIATTYFGHAQSERVQGIARMSNGDILIAGETNSDFPVSGSSPFANATGRYHVALTPGCSGGGCDLDGYVAILSSDLQTLKHWTYVGGERQDRAYQAIQDPSTLDIWVVGLTESAPGSGLGTLPLRLRSRKLQHLLRNESRWLRCVPREIQR
jgi:hypothetical protein